MVEGTSITDSGIPLVFPTHFLSIDDVREYVARETEKQRLAILSAQAKILQLYTFQNSFAPPTLSPPEILRHIFSYLNFPQGHNASLVRATHICKQWRAVALADPSLWSSFTLHNPDGIKECLIRSKNMPLSLSLALKPSTNSATHIQGASHRFKSLSIAIPEAEGIETLLNTLKAGAPLLQELSVMQSLPDYCSGRFHHRPVVLTGPYFIFDETLELPSLRSLVLDDVPIPFLPPPTLQCLDLNMSVRDPGHNLPRFPELLALLERCSQLREVKLHGRTNKSGQPTSGTTITLPNLAHLTLALYPLPRERDPALPPRPSRPHHPVSADRCAPPPAGPWPTSSSSSNPSTPRCAGRGALRRLLLAWAPGRWDLQAHRAADDFTDARRRTGACRCAGPSAGGRSPRRTSRSWCCRSP